MQAFVRLFLTITYYGAELRMKVILRTMNVNILWQNDEFV